VKIQDEYLELGCNFCAWSFSSQKYNNVDFFRPDQTITAHEEAFNVSFFAEKTQDPR